MRTDAIASNVCWASMIDDVSGCPAALMRWRFWFRHRQLPAPVANRLEALLVANDCGLCCLHLHHAPE